MQSSREPPTSEMPFDGRYALREDVQIERRQPSFSSTAAWLSARIDPIDGIGAQGSYERRSQRELIEPRVCTVGEIPV